MPKDEPETENFGKTLKIEQVTSADEGKYECTASNPMGSAKHEFHVHVEGAHFNWTKDGKPFDLSSDPRIVTTNNSGTFVIQNRGIINNFQGKYRCFASNVLGTAMSEEIELIVPSVPKFPKEKIEPLDAEHGDSVILHCNPPKGIPPLHIYWMNIVI
ncbi:hypothetical protein EK904_011982 [Melospiza melodia maxima]|nr:hypothetical protein EK904_011982 [Melospiza melodia maxima]